MKLQEIKEWYDGYNFGGQEIYNPWSTVNYFRHDCTPAAYWVNTSGNAILGHLLKEAKLAGRQMRIEWGERNGQGEDYRRAKKGFK